MRYRPSGRIGFILSNDAICLHPAVLTSDYDRASKMDVSAVPRWLDEFCRRESRRPVSKLALHGGNRRLIILVDGCFVGCIETINRPLNRGQTFGRDEVRMRGNWTVGEVYRTRPRLL